MVGQVFRGPDGGPRVVGVCYQPPSKGFRSNCGGDVCECRHDDRASDDAPSYEMPAVKLGRDWTTVTVGTTVNISNAFTGLASFTAQAGQTGVTTYGGRVGLNYMIN
jgi:hypothetical protein